jgi:hypothetical protein
MKKLISSITLVALIGMIVAVGAGASDTDSVLATVTVETVSISVEDGTVAYGTLAVNTSESTLLAELNDMQIATNDGNVTEDFNIMGTDSTGWELSTSTNGVDQYVHKFCNDTDNDCDTPPTNYTAMDEGSYTALDTDIVADGTVDFQLRITTPTLSTSAAEQSVDVTVQAVES